MNNKNYDKQNNQGKERTQCIFFFLFVFMVMIFIFFVAGRNGKISGKRNGKRKGEREREREKQGQGNTQNSRRECFTTEYLNSNSFYHQLTLVHHNYLGECRNSSFYQKTFKKSGQVNTLVNSY